MSEQVPEFTIVRRFDAPVERVFEAWADPAKMVQWSGPAGSRVDIIAGELAEGKSSISHTSGEGFPEMYSLCLWREIRPHTRISWEQSFCDRDGNKTIAPFFDHWPLTLLTVVDLVPLAGRTELTLRWIPIEYDQASLDEFVRQMAGMTGGWGGSFDKLDAYLSAFD